MVNKSYQRTLPERLSQREREVLALIVAEYTTEEIAQELYLSQETVKTHRKHLLHKCKAKNVAGLVRRAFEFKLIALGYV